MPDRQKAPETAAESAFKYIPRGDEQGVMGSRNGCHERTTHDPVVAARDEGIDFARFLREHDLLPHEQADALRERARCERLPLGRLLVMNGTLRVQQVLQILDVQAEQPNLRFGEIAVMLGVLSTVELEAALRQQREQRPHLIDLIRQEGLVPRRTLDSALLKYVEFLEMSSIDAASTTDP